MERQKVYEIIDGERNYQDSLIEKGMYEITIKSVGEEILMIHHYANLAERAWTENKGNDEGLKVVRKIAALCVRCMENNGAIPR